ncbi:hypothetical protein [Phaeacidiphilus oryzae]|uniref:hypothetical protein n=1 Tax=Phaeacidiphilus oryzae TaxID=348818 RepID=UPI00068ABD96|nr:hypothetical protein [Phaeacidiphilus oryzae]
MSLSRPAIALGALVVVGCAIAAGTSAANASSITKPQPLATVTVGKGFKTAEPTCYNDGKPLSDAQVKLCQTKALSAASQGKLPSINVRSNDMVSVGLDETMAGHGWDAFTDGGDSSTTGSGQAVLSGWTRSTTFSGQVRATQVMSSSKAKTLLTVVSMDQGNKAYGVWYYELDNKSL